MPLADIRIAKRDTPDTPEQQAAPGAGGTPLAHTRCPLCGGPNDCAPAACGRFDTPCWCRQASFGASLLAQVPPPQRGLACICAACATRGGPPPA